MELRKTLLGPANIGEPVMLKLADGTWVNSGAKIHSIKDEGTRVIIEEVDDGHSQYHEVDRDHVMLKF